MNRSRNRTFVLAILVATFALGAATRVSEAGEPCAVSTLFCSLATQTVTASSGALECDGGDGIVRFNLVAGTLEAIAEDFASCRVETGDDYIVTGPPNGTPLTLLLKVDAAVASGTGHDFGVVPPR